MEPNFFLPLIVLNQDSLYPLTLGLNVWNSVSSNAGGKPVYNLIALGSLISVLPLLIAFIVLGKYWRGGLNGQAPPKAKRHQNSLGKSRDPLWLMRFPDCETFTMNKSYSYDFVSLPASFTTRSNGPKPGGIPTLRALPRPA